MKLDYLRAEYIPFGHYSASCKNMVAQSALYFCGDERIRTSGQIAPSLAFQASAFNHSATSPKYVNKKKHEVCVSFSLYHIEYEGKVNYFLSNLTVYFINLYIFLTSMLMWRKWRRTFFYFFIQMLSFNCVIHNSSN